MKSCIVDRLIDAIASSYDKIERFDLTRAEAEELWDEVIRTRHPGATIMPEDDGLIGRFHDVPVYLYAYQN